MANAARLFGVALAVLVAGTLAAPAQQPKTDTEQPKAERSARPYLGVFVDRGERGQPGVILREITPDSPAAKAGLKEGDHVSKVDDQDIRGPEMFLQTIAGKKSGDQVKILLHRGGQEQTVTVTLGERPASAEQPGMPNRPGMGTFGRRPAFLGVTTEAITPEVKQRLNVKADAGVVVTEIMPRSPAATAGLKTDDVITAVNDQQIRDPNQLREIVQQQGAGKDVTIKVARGNDTVDVKAKLGEAGFGMFQGPRESMFPRMDQGMMMDPNNRIRELERRIDELERRVRELERKQGGAKD